MALSCTPTVARYRLPSIRTGVHCCGVVQIGAVCLVHSREVSLAGEHCWQTLPSVRAVTCHSPPLSKGNTSERLPCPAWVFFVTEQGGRQLYHLNFAENVQNRPKGPRRPHFRERGGQLGLLNFVITILESSWTTQLRLQNDGAGQLNLRDFELTAAPLDHSLCVLE